MIELMWWLCDSARSELRNNVINVDYSTIQMKITKHMLHQSLECRQKRIFQAKTICNCTHLNQMCPQWMWYIVWIHLPYLPAREVINLAPAKASKVTSIRRRWYESAILVDPCRGIDRRDPSLKKSNYQALWDNTITAIAKVHLLWNPG